MSYSGLIKDYIQSGTHALRPATPNVAADVAPIYYETDTGNTFIWSGSAWVQMNAGGGATGYILIADHQSQGTSGGSATSGSWQTRTLNTIVNDTTGAVALSSNQITLPSGTYRARISAPAFQCDQHQTRLQNVTDSVTVLIGSSEVAGHSGSYNGETTRSLIIGRFTIAASKLLEVQHQVATSQSSNGYGLACNFTTEIYTVVELEKE